MHQDRATICHVNLARGYRGGERQTELLVRELAGRGWPQRLVVRRGQTLARALAGTEGLLVVESRASGMDVIRAIGRPGLIHVHEGRSLRYAWANSLITRAPFIVTRRVQHGPRRHWLNRLMYRRAARVVALSSAISESMAALDPLVAVEVIPSATSGLQRDAAGSAALRARWGGDFIVGHVGALDDSHKGQGQIVSLARTLGGRHADIRFVLVGSGPDENLLREAARRDPRLILVGHVDRVGEYLGAFDAFLFPSRHEGLGSILLDALDFGLPVVATRVGGIPELIEDGVNGLLVSVDDINGMRSVICALASDEDLRSRLGEAGRRTAREYSTAVMADRYENVYASVLGQREERAA